MSRADVGVGLRGLAQTTELRKHFVCLNYYVLVCVVAGLPSKFSSVLDWCCNARQHKNRAVTAADSYVEYILSNVMCVVKRLSHAGSQIGRRCAA